MDKSNQTKSGAHFSINTKILSEFKEKTKLKAVNMSALIQQFMEKWIKEN